MSNVVKASFNLYQSDIDALKKLAKEHTDGNVTQALRAAIATESFMRDTAAQGDKILLEKPDGRVQEIVFQSGGTSPHVDRLSKEQHDQGEGHSR